MPVKHRVLIVEGQPEWLQLLCEALPADRFEVHTARSYDEALSLLGNNTFNVAIVDPVLDSAAQNEKGTDGMALLNHLWLNHRRTGLIVVSGTVGRELLRNAPDLPPHLPMVYKQNWDTKVFLEMMESVLSGEKWGPQEPRIELPPQPPSRGSMQRSTSQLLQHLVTGPLAITGKTGPLSSGLEPPPVGSRPGTPRALIVEGNPQWQHQLAELMERERYFWRVAPDYEHAMERLRLEVFHIVLIDLAVSSATSGVSNGKGWALLDYLVNHAPNTKVFAVSGNMKSTDVARLFMRYPIKGFIDKESFNEMEFLEAVRQQFVGPRLRIQTLGDFRIWRDDKPITNFGDDNAEKLLKILLTRRGENVSVDELIEYLWPGYDLKTASSALSTTIANARTALEPDLPRANDSHYILRNGANYSFNPMANVQIDAEQMRGLISEGNHHERNGELHEALRDYEAARVMYQGDYLSSERSARWALQERSALQSLYTLTLNHIADLYAGMEQLNLAIEAAQRSLQIDSYNESTYRRLMRYYACQGNQNGALSVYRALVKLFSEFFGEEPSQATIELHDDIEEGRPVNCVEGSTGSSGEWRALDERLG